MRKHEKKELWIWQITEEDILAKFQFPEFRILARTIQEMKDLIKAFWEGGYHVKILKCRKMTNADWLYFKEYLKWWNDYDLITPDRRELH